MNTLVFGWGEVGGAHGRLLSKKFKVRGIDKMEGRVPENLRFNPDEEWETDLLLVGIRYGAEFHDVVQGAVEIHKPAYLCILSTVPPGTTALFGDRACHSTTRGLHPNLDHGLQNITKHVGGPAAKIVGKAFAQAGMPVRTHNRAETTEVAHILNNAAYGVNVMFAAEMARICREYGVDYVESVMEYTRTNNEGYIRLDQASKCRMILTPPPDKIGGHCLVQSANLIPTEKRGPLLDMLAKYNEREKP